jgi:hypothetical protein
MSLIRSRFALLNLLQDVIDMRPFNGIVAISILDGLLDFLEIFSSDSEYPHKFAYWHQAV